MARASSAKGSGGRGVTAALFVVVALVAAFAVSALAGWLGDGQGDGVGGRAGRARAPVVPAEVRVEVLNGAGKSNLARDATHVLRSAGFDVVYFGNAGTFERRHSVVLDRLGEIERARAVAASLGIDSVATARDSSLLLDVSVLLGDDWPAAPERGGMVERARGLVGGS